MAMARLPVSMSRKALHSIEVRKIYKLLRLISTGNQIYYVETNVHVSGAHSCLMVV